MTEQVIETEPVSEITDEVVEPIEEVVETPPELLEELPAESADVEPSTDDNPFAEFEEVPKTIVENLSSIDGWKYVPNVIKAEIGKLDEKNAETEALINDLGGREVLEVYKPLTEVILSSNPTAEGVEKVFETLDAHNPKVVEQMGASFTREWLAGIKENPTTISPVLQTVFKDVFGEAGAQFDLMALAEIVQLVLTTDEDGDPLLDLEIPRERFKLLGGQTYFQRKVTDDAKEQRIKELEAKLNRKTEAPPQKEIENEKVETELQTIVWAPIEKLLTNLGYGKDSFIHSIVADAVAHRIANSPENKTISEWAKNGSIRKDGKLILGVERNADFLKNKIWGSVVKGLKEYQGTAKAKSAGTRDNKLAANAAGTEEKPVATTAPIQPKTPDPSEKPVFKNENDYMTWITNLAKQKQSDLAVAQKLSLGK